MKLLLFIILLICTNASFGEEPFKRSDTAKIDGTHYVKDLVVAPSFLVKEFGAPGQGDGLRVSGIYVFVSSSGQVFTIYDYKSTTIWAVDEGLLSPEAFWASNQPQELSIGSRDNHDYESFYSWLMTKYSILK